MLEADHNHGHVADVSRCGHGRSSQGAVGHDIDTHATDVAAAVRKLDLRDGVHIGHSTGAFLRG